MAWHSIIQQDLSKLADAIVFFERELDDAKKECKLYGSIEKAAAAMPGQMEHRFGQLQEIESILEYLNIQLRKIRSKHFRKYLENYQRSLSSRDCEKFVDGEAEVIDQELLINEFALLRNKWIGLIKAFDQKSFSISNIIKLRAVGIDDASF